MKTKFKTKLLLLSFISMCIISCSPNPDDYGKKIADKTCECEKIRLNYEMKILNAKKEKLTTTQFANKDEYEKWIGEWAKTFSYENPELDKCREEEKKMQSDAELKFTKEDDRTTLKNSYNANYEEKRKDLYVEFAKMNEEVRKLENKIPYR